MRTGAMRGACAVLAAAAVALLAAPAAARLFLEEIDEEVANEEAAAAEDGPMAQMMRTMREACYDETGVDLSLVDKVNGGADLMPDPLLKCYIKCVMETAALLRKGVVDVDAAVALLPPELGEQNAPALRACGTRTGADDCDTAYLTQVCWQNANKEQYFLI